MQCNPLLDLLCGLMDQRRLGPISGETCLRLLWADQQLDDKCLVSWLAPIRVPGNYKAPTSRGDPLMADYPGKRYQRRSP